MDLQTFKQEAVRRGNIVDNRENAGRELARTWGLSWWYSLWAFQEYTLGNMSYKTGTVTLRHTHYRRTECRIDGEPVSDYKFKKALDVFDAPEPTPDERQHIADYEAQQEVKMAAALKHPHSRQARRMTLVTKNPSYQQTELQFAS